MLSALAETGVLQTRSPEDDTSVARSLLRILDEPRHDGFDGEHVYWGLLERLYNPATNTQRINVPFATGAWEAGTCVSAARVFVLISKHPAEYARMIVGLTSPDASFTITRAYPQPVLFEQKRAWLRGAFAFAEIDERVLRITVRPDDQAVPRAILEQTARLYEEYDFGLRNDKNSRHLIDVMLQSALTNYALRGAYASAADICRGTGRSGVPFLDALGRPDFGYESLNHDILTQRRMAVV